VTASSPIRASTYLAAQRWRRRLLLTLEKPWALLAVIIGLAISAALQLYVLRSTMTASLPPAVVDLVAQLAPFLFPVVAFSATFRTPLKLDIADVSWVLPAPGGPRVLLARHLFGYPVLLAVLGGLGAVLSRSFASLPVISAWKVAVVLGGAVLAVRLVTLLAHLFALRARVLTRVLVLVWAVGLAAATVAGAPTSSARGEPVVRRWVRAVTDADAVEASWVLVPCVAVALLAMVAVGTARGYIEPANDRARQNAELQASMRRDTTGLETGANWFRSGLRSWSGTSRLTGERALLFRGVAQQRRMRLASSVELAVELLITIALLVLAPHLAWLPLAFVLLITVLTSSFTGIAVELDHHHIWVAPLRPLVALLCATAIPAATISASAEVLWLTLLVGGVLGGGTWLAGTLLIPLVSVVVLLAGAVGIAAGGRGVLRMPLSLGFAAAGIAPTAVLAFVPTAPAVGAVAVALIGLATAAALVVRGRLWPSSRPEPFPARGERANIA
jgi:hypothetical protein